MLDILPNTKLTLKKWPKTFEMLPNWKFSPNLVTQVMAYEVTFCVTVTHRYNCFKGPDKSLKLTLYFTGDWMFKVT